MGTSAAGVVLLNGSTIWTKSRGAESLSISGMRYITEAGYGISPELRQYSTPDGRVRSLPAVSPDGVTLKTLLYRTSTGILVGTTQNGFFYQHPDRRFQYFNVPTLPNMTRAWANDRGDILGLATDGSSVRWSPSSGIRIQKFGTFISSNEKLEFFVDTNESANGLNSVRYRVFWDDRRDVVGGTSGFHNEFRDVSIFNSIGTELKSSVAGRFFDPPERESNVLLSRPGRGGGFFSQYAQSPGNAARGFGLGSIMGFDDGNNLLATGYTTKDHVYRTYYLEAVPEPATFLTLASLSAGLMLRKKKVRRSSQTLMAISILPLMLTTFGEASFQREPAFFTHYQGSTSAATMVKLSNEGHVGIYTTYYSPDFNPAPTAHRKLYGQPLQELTHGFSHLNPNPNIILGINSVGHLVGTFSFNYESYAGLWAASISPFNLSSLASEYTDFRTATGINNRGTIVGLQTNGRPFMLFPDGTCEYFLSFPIDMSFSRQIFLTEDDRAVISSENNVYNWSRLGGLQQAIVGFRLHAVSRNGRKILSRWESISTNVSILRVYQQVANETPARIPWLTDDEMRTYSYFGASINQSGGILASLGSVSGSKSFLFLPQKGLFRFPITVKDSDGVNTLEMRGGQSINDLGQWVGNATEYHSDGSIRDTVSLVNPISGRLPSKPKIQIARPGRP
mgnify:FL=1